MWRASRGGAGDAAASASVRNCGAQCGRTGCDSRSIATSTKRAMAATLSHAARAKARSASASVAPMMMWTNGALKWPGPKIAPEPKTAVRRKRLFRQLSDDERHEL